MNRFEYSPVVIKFRESFKRFIEIDDPHFILGVSGGVDSMSLLYLLQRHDFKTTVVHCNYHLRGEASDKDQELVEQISGMWGFDCITAGFDPGEANESNSQLWARDSRYRVFRDLKDNLEVDYILTAHHQTDQVETILQKILRGSGLESWSGMQMLDGDLFRPLLNVKKEEIVEFAGNHEVPFREDASNLEEKYARNIIRHNLEPQMDRFFPGWDQNILKIPDRADEFSLLVQNQLNQIKDQAGLLNRDKLLALDKRLWPVILHHFLKRENPDVSLPEGLHQRFQQIDTLQTGAQIEIDPQLSLLRDRDYFRLVEHTETPPDEQTIRKKDLNRTVTIDDLSFRIEQWEGVIDETLLQLDADKQEWPLTIRRWKNGDRIQPLGMEGSQLISDLLTNHKISSARKREARLIESFDGIVSAVIFPHTNSDGRPGIISEQVKCTSGTKHTLTIDKAH